MNLQRSDVCIKSCIARPARATWESLYDHFLDIFVAYEKQLGLEYKKELKFDCFKNEAACTVFADFALTYL